MESHIFGKFIDWALAGLGTIIAAVWADNRRRQEKMQELLENKADKVEMDRQRDNISSLFDGQTTIRRDMAEGFASMSSKLHEIHVDILGKIK